MKVFKLNGAEDLRAGEAAIADLKYHEVLVRVKCTGICGSDTHYYRQGRCGPFIPRKPFRLGHEFSAEVVDPGSFSETLPYGTRVAIDPSDNCGECSQCRSGHSNHCVNMRYFGSAACYPHQDGSHCEFLTVRADKCHRLPDNVSDRHGALIEPLAIALHAVEQAGELEGHRVLVIGGGTIGQLVGQICKHFAAESITLCDFREKALSVALDTWAAHAVKPNQIEGDYDVVFEASGAGAALVSAYEACALRGTIVQVGTYPDTVSLPVQHVVKKELTVRGSFRFSNCFAQALELVSRQSVHLDRLITHEFKFDQMVEAFEAAIQPDALKVTVSYN